MPVGCGLLGVSIDGDLPCVLAGKEVLMNGVFDFG
jgi:hypothetical protein